MPNVIEAERVLLREVSPAEAQALVKGKRPDMDAWAVGYPVEGTLDASRMLLRQVASQQWRPGFGMYQIIRRRDSTIIGDIGFHSPPDAQGRVVVGFGLAASARGQGYATEALVALTRWAVAQPEVRVVAADTTHANVASQAVVTRAGFRHAGDDQQRRYYEYAADAEAGGHPPRRRPTARPRRGGESRHRPAWFTRTPR